MDHFASHAPAHTAFQIVAIVEGKRTVLTTCATLEDAITAQAMFPVASRIIELDVDFDPTREDHLN